MLAYVAYVDYIAYVDWVMPYMAISLSLCVCHGYHIESRDGSYPILSSGALESQCRSSSIVSYNITII